MSTRKLPCWLWTGATVAGVVWGATAARAQFNVHLEAGRHPEASIHFGSRPPPWVGPVLPPGGIRTEHFVERERERERGNERERERGRDWDRYGRPNWVVPPGVVYRNPYREDYYRRFRPGYFPVVVSGAQYYVYPGLPPGYQSVVVNGVTYYFFDGVYYQPYLYQGQTVFMVVPPPLP